jgi:hypothetical protein
MMQQRPQEACMDGLARRFAQMMVRRALALFGTVGALSAATPAAAVPSPERVALEARVADMRRHLNSAPGVEAVSRSAGATLVAQAGKWNNWPNWSNWANWRNG